jgi:hypothetical protein
MRMFSIVSLILVMTWHGPTMAARERVQVRPSGLAQLPLAQRCAIAKLLARQVRDVVTWSNPAKLPGIALSDGIDLIIATNRKGPPQSLFNPDEACEISIDRGDGSGKMQIRLARGIAPPLPSGRSYAVLFSQTLSPGRWEFTWPFVVKGFTGCSPQSGGATAPTIDTCLTLFHGGPPAPELRIVVSRISGGVATSSAALEFAAFSEMSR